MREFATGATRDEDSNKLDYEGFVSPVALTRFAQYMHEHRFQADGKVRASDNWQKGIPVDSYQKSLIRHVIDAWQMWRANSLNTKEGQDLLCAIFFNVQGLLHELNKNNPILNPQYYAMDTRQVDYEAFVSRGLGLKPYYEDDEENK